MRMLTFAARNRKEIFRDPLSLFFGIGFPVVLLLLISFMKQSMKGMPDSLFSIDSFAPGMAIFGLSFLSLFLGMLLANDRNNSFLQRIFASPLTGFDYILGYTLPMMLVSFLQSSICFGTAAFLGLKVDLNTVVAVLVLLPVALLFCGFGILFGTLFNYKQVGGISSVLINVAAWLSGVWFNLDMVGGAFRKVCYILPFAHANDAIKNTLAGNYADLPFHLAVVILYAVVVYGIAVYCFGKKMKG